MRKELRMQFTGKKKEQKKNSIKKTDYFFFLALGLNSLISNMPSSFGKLGVTDATDAINISMNIRLNENAKEGPRLGPNRSVNLSPKNNIVVIIKPSMLISMNDPGSGDISRITITSFA
ncbi:MAG: hypothetical protein GY861_07185 [bacterium]|nr:hypothetical protein [bacterium]